MRFGNGAWRMLPGVVPSYLSRIDGAEISERELVLHVFNKLGEERWDTLEGDMFTVRITAPADNVFRIRVTHHKGRARRGPQGFDVAADELPLDAKKTESGFEMASGDLALIVDKKPWGLRFVDKKSGEPVTESPFKALGLMNRPGVPLHMREQLKLQVGELIYGLGERFQAFTRNGQLVDMWNDDCGTCSDKGYKDVPFFMSNRGWGVLVNSSARVSFEIGTEQVMRAQFAVPGEDLDYFLIHGPTPKELLRRLGALVGRPALPPAWSFGLWLTTSFLTNYDEDTVMEHLDGMRDRNLPLHVFHFDCFWMKGHHWCNLKWDEASFPEPEAMLKRLHDRGLHLCVWINPYIAERSHLFDEGLTNGYLLRRPNGDVFQRPKWQAGMGYVDFTNPEAKAWYQQKLRSLLKMGVDCFKTDFGEEIPTDVVYHDGSDPELMHNYYTFLYNQAVFELLEEERGEGEACLFARSATATCGRFPVHWGGDCYGNFESMAESLRGGLSLMLSGFGFWSHDIGGFESKASAHVYKRWVQFGLLSSHSRLHGNTSYRVPWMYDEEAVDVVRRFTQLKCRLMPYLMRAAAEAHEQSVPMMRAMLLEFPDDPTCRTLDRQYMLGEGVLVAPVFHESRAEYYLPDGEWTHLLSGETRGGGRWFHEEYDFSSLPLFVRDNSLVALGDDYENVVYDYTKGVTLFSGKLDGKSPASVGLADTQGKTRARVSLTQSGQSVTLENSGISSYHLQLPWAKAAEKLEGARLVDPPKEQRPGDTPGVWLLVESERASFVWR